MEAVPGVDNLTVRQRLKIAASGIFGSVALVVALFIGSVPLYAGGFVLAFYAIGAYAWWSIRSEDDARYLGRLDSGTEHAARRFVDGHYDTAAYVTFLDKHYKEKSEAARKEPARSCDPLDRAWQRFKAELDGPKYRSGVDHGALGKLTAPRARWGYHPLSRALVDNEDIADHTGWVIRDVREDPVSLRIMVVWQEVGRQRTFNKSYTPEGFRGWQGDLDFHHLAQRIVEDGVQHIKAMGVALPAEIAG